MFSNVDSNCNFSERTFQILPYSRQRPGFSAQRAALPVKIDFCFLAFFYNICWFRSSSLLSLQVFVSWKETIDSSLTVKCFPWTNHNSLLRIATNDIVSFYIDNTSYVLMAFLLVCQIGQMPGFATMLKDFETKTLFVCTSCFFIIWNKHIPCWCASVQ